MWQTILALVLGSITALFLSESHVSGTEAVDTPSCGDFGTAVHFQPTPSAAARKALKEEKLVCVLHVSGIFENPDFT